LNEQAETKEKRRVLVNGRKNHLKKTRSTKRKGPSTTIRDGRG